MNQLGRVIVIMQLVNLNFRKAALFAFNLFKLDLALATALFVSPSVICVRIKLTSP